MKREKIIDIISHRSLASMKVIRVKCRPPEKSNAVLTTLINGKLWLCERPTYFWSKFDRYFVENGFLVEQKTLYPKIAEPLTLLDTRGLYWSRYEMSSFGLVKYFLENPFHYIYLLLKRTQEMHDIIQMLQKIRPTLKKQKYFEKNLKIFVNLFTVLFEKSATVYVAFDEIVWQFRKLLLEYLPKEMVNLYFTQFLSSEITKFALKKGYITERGIIEHAKTRGVLYAMDLKPRLFYIPPKLFHEYHNDYEINSLLLKKNITKDNYKKFLAFRMMVPFGFQINEESQYIETSGLSAHFGIFIRALGRHIHKSLDEIQSMDIKNLLHLIKKNA